MDIKLYKDCKEIAASIPNLRFLGGLSFQETSTLFSNVKLFVCTSEIEGFPNTFLQAWANQCPVLTTFDPSGLIKNLQLGLYCEDFDDLLMGFDFLQDQSELRKIHGKIKNYFNENHSAQYQYERLSENFNLG